MDIQVTHGSRIITVSRAAYARPDTDFLCFGESDVDSPAAAHAAIVAALARGETRYPDVRGVPALRQALSDYLGVDEARVQVTGSGMAAISVAMSALIRPGDRLVHITPAWPNSANAARLRGAEVEEFALSPAASGGFALDMDRLAARLEGARALFVNSPSNPTGWTASGAEMAEIVALCRLHGVWLISDEVYGNLIYDDAAHAASALDFAAADDRVLVAGSFSKTWAMTGWRVGWLVVPAGARDSVTELVEITHSGVAPFVQAGALAALADVDFAARFRAYCAAGREATAAALADVPGVHYASPPGAFYAFLKIDGLRDSLALALRLVERHGVAVAPGSAFGAGGEGYVRLCFAQSPARLERALGRLVAGIGQFAGSPAARSAA
jgi:aspartate/methionine/tyrosine aminotransferase